MSKKIVLTEDQIHELKERLYELEHVLIPQNSKDIKAAKEQGDLSENAEYDEAKDTQAKLHQEVLVIKNKIENAVILQESTNKNQVDIGHTVVVEYIEEKKTKTLKLLGEWDKSKESTSVDSPLGYALIGKKPGDEFMIDAPMGEIKCRLISIL